MASLNELHKKVQFKILGDPAVCIISFKIKAALLYLSIVGIITTIIVWIKN